MSPCLSEDAVLAFTPGGKTGGPTRRASRGAPRDVRRVPRARLGAGEEERAGSDHVEDAYAVTVPSTPAARVPPRSAGGDGRRQVRGGVAHRRGRHGRRRGGDPQACSASASPSSSRSPSSSARPRGASGLLREARACAQPSQRARRARARRRELDDGAPYIVMEYLEGRTLAERLREEGPLPLADAVDTVRRRARRSTRRTPLGIVHRDLKPSNLFETRRFDGTRLVKVLDFGIAKGPALASEGDGLTTTRGVMGSPAYMSPEQLRSTRDVDARRHLRRVSSRGSC